MLENYKSSLLDIISMLFISAKIYFLTHFENIILRLFGFLKLWF